MIELDGVRVVFDRTVALDDITLRIDPGITGVFGPNASGKSTLLRLIAGLTRPSSGTVRIDRVPLSASNEAFRRLVGYAGHDAGLYPRLSVEENLTLFARLHGARRDRVTSMLEQLGLASRANTPVADLSAGLKRRAAVARALVHDPQVLLLDEPYANLDDDAAALVSASVKSWSGPDRVGLVASHGAKRVKAFADASLVLRRAQVASFRRRVPEEMRA